MTNQNSSRLFFEGTSDSVIILQDQRIKELNPAAEKLLETFEFELERVLEVCQAQGCELHSTMSHCLNCEVKHNFDPQAFSLVLRRKNGQRESFSASYQQMDQHGTYGLSLRNLTAQDKTDHLRQQKQLVAYVSRAHEKERKKIAQDLHDGLAQSVFSTLLETRQISRYFSKEPLLTSKLNQVEDQLVRTLDEIKRMALDLRPSALDDLGLPSAIGSLIQRLAETTGIEITFIPQLKHQRFSENIELTLYRVLQEALMNAIKYADVASIDVLLVEKERVLVLEIIDLGKGFATSAPVIQGTGMGLLHMEERVEMINGRLWLTSAEGKGTHVKVEVPLEEGKEAR